MCSHHHNDHRVNCHHNVCNVHPIITSLECEGVDGDDEGQGCPDPGQKPQPPQTVVRAGQHHRECGRVWPLLRGQDIGMLHIHYNESYTKYVHTILPFSMLAFDYKFNKSNKNSNIAH